MNVALLGASGFVGSAILREALSRGHQVTAVVRHPEKLPAQANLITKQCDVNNSQELAGLLSGHDAVISAYNPGWNNPNLYSDQIKGTESILAGIKLAGIKRVLWVGGAGSLEIKPGFLVMDTPDFPAHIRPASQATAEALASLRNATDLDWSFLCPTGKMEAGQRTAKFRLGADQPLIDEKGQSEISVEDYAVAMIDELERPAHIRQRFTVGY
jgi:uncharacterized protein